MFKVFVNSMIILKGNIETCFKNNDKSLVFFFLEKKYCIEFIRFNVFTLLINEFHIAEMHNCLLMLPSDEVVVISGELLRDPWGVAKG